MENKIRERRKELGMSQGQLARKVGVSQGKLSHWEKGDWAPQLFNAICLAQALETTVEELFSP